MKNDPRNHTNGHEEELNKSLNEKWKMENVEMIPSSPAILRSSSRAPNSDWCLGLLATWTRSGCYSFEILITIRST